MVEITPCSHSEPVTASAKQISQIPGIMDANARPIQQIGRRMALAPQTGH